MPKKNACITLILWLLSSIVITGFGQGQQPPLSRAEEKIKSLPLPQQASYYAGKFLEELPNFIVTQVVSRSVRRPNKKDWQAQDQLEIEMTYSAKDGEKFKLLKINGRPTSQRYETLRGASSIGQFAGIIASLIAPRSQAQFKEVGREEFRGHKTVLYDFVVKKANSDHFLKDQSSGLKVITGFKGTAWIDSETARILRVEHSAEDIQPGFPITMGEFAVEYDWVTIAGKKYLMPVSAEMILGYEAQQFYQRNVIELRNYRVFDTDVKIILDKDPPK